MLGVLRTSQWGHGLMRLFSTDKVDPGHRVEYWGALASDTICPMSVGGVRSPAAFAGRLWAYNRIGPIDVIRACSTSVVLRRTGLDVARTQSRRFLVSMAEDTTHLVRTRQWEHVLRPNDLLIIDTTERGETIHSGCTAMTLSIAETDFKQYLPGADDLSGLVVRGDRGAGLLAATLIRALTPSKSHEFANNAGEHVATALLHAIAAAYAERYGTTTAPGSRATARQLAITRFVDDHLHDGDLTVQKVAADFALSDRYVRMLFADRDESLAAYIQRRRLEESARQLRDPLWRSRTISDIALNWGFNSLGSYDRAFKARFDVTPRQYRERALSSLGVDELAPRA
jgi:AraC family transcriptional activator of tynA and feaB